VTASQPIFPTDRTVRAEAPTASIYSFVPAGGTDRARNAVRQLSEAMRAEFTADGDGRSVLLADFLDAQAGLMSSILCVDLAAANPEQIRQALAFSEAVFVVSATDPASIEDARAQAARLQREFYPVLLEEACGLLLVPVSGGVTVVEAEARIGIPVCGVFRSPSHIAQLARWIAQE